jgi:hypothetical protein
MCWILIAGFFCSYATLKIRACLINQWPWDLASGLQCACCGVAEYQRKQ